MRAVNPLSDMIFFFLVWVFQFFITVHCVLRHRPSVTELGDIIKNHNDDAGEPLFLTPYVESGDIEKGRQLARVPFTENFNITSYAGFFTVDKNYDSNLYFWYFPPIEPKDDVAPVMVWLQGGPGSSSLYGLFVENGPLRVHNGTFEARKINWALHNHMIYIDSPVGAGFSFTNNTEGYCTSETQIGEHLYSTIIQFFRLFPALQKNNFFISGESYAGKYIPAFAYTIHKKNPTAALRINLKGLAIGNGLTDPVNQLVYHSYLYEIGLIDKQQADIVEGIESHTVSLINEQQWTEAHSAVHDIWNNISAMSNYSLLYNYLDPSTDPSNEEYENKIQEDCIRKDIHVGSLPYNTSTNAEDLVHKYLIDDFMQSVKDWLSELLDYYHVVMYAGQLDIILPYSSMLNYLQKLKFNGSQEYTTAKRHVWKVDGEIAGYVKIGGNLIEVLVRNAGHMVPRDQPKWTFDLITRMTSSIWD